MTATPDNLAAMALPAAPFVLKILLSTTFILHVLFMNLMVGLSVMGLFAFFSDNPTLTFRIKTELKKRLVIIIAFVVNTGVAPLLFLQVLYSKAFYTGTIHMAWYWLSIPFLILFAYYGAYLFQGSERFEKKGYGLFFLLMLSAGFLLSNGFSSHLAPFINSVSETSVTGKTLAMPVFYSLIRYSHMISAAIANAALFTWIYASKKQLDELISFSRNFFLYGFIAAIITGVLYLFSLESQWIGWIMTTQHLPFYLFALSLPAILLTLIGAVLKRKPMCMIGVAATFLPMILLRDALRTHALESSVAHSSVLVSHGPFFVFAAIILIGCGLIGVMYRLSDKKFL